MNSKRIIAFLIDYSIACFIQAVLMTLYFIKPILNNSLNNETIDLIIRLYIITYCSVSYLIIRDIIGKRSIGKIIMKLKIIDENNGNEASVFKRFLRNITMLLSPIEIIAFLITKKRIGDKLAKTNVINID